MRVCSLSHCFYADVVVVVVVVVDVDQQPLE